jgi:hypothetical protein
LCSKKEIWISRRVVKELGIWRMREWRTQEENVEIGATKGRRCERKLRKWKGRRK